MGAALPTVSVPLRRNLCRISGKFGNSGGLGLVLIGFDELRIGSEGDHQ
jgi:hypothetical protein